MPRPTRPTTRPATSLSARGRLVLALATAAAIGGCISPRYAARDADRTAYRIIREKQQAALGRTEPFRLERPEDELRRRLMLDQKLPAGAASSFGRPFLPPVPKEPAGVSPNLPLPEEAVLVNSRDARVRGVKTPTLATDVFLFDIGRDPGAGAVPAEPQVVFGPPDPATIPLEPEPLVVTLLDALYIAANNNHDYQSQKEQVFLAALDLDLERDQFEFRFGGTFDAEIASELEGDDQTGVVLSPALEVGKLFKNGAQITTRIGVDLAKLLTGNGGESLGTFADPSIAIPLLRGAGVEIVTENLQQAEREAIYAIWDFESFKRDFAVNVVGSYLNVLGDLKSIENSRANYRSTLAAAERARALFDAGQLPLLQVDQATQNALQAQNRLLSAQQQYDSSLDRFKVLLGLPPDALVELDPVELERLTPLAEAVLGEGEALGGLRGLGPATEPATQPATQPATGPGTGPGLPDVREALDPTTTPAEIESEEEIQRLGTQPSTLPATGPSTRGGIEVESTQPATLPATDLDIESPLGRDTGVRSPMTQWAIRTALRNRLDLAIAYGQVVDAQRQTVLAADDLQAGLDLNAGAAYGSRRGAFSGDQPNGSLNLREGSYSGTLSLDLPIEATSERNAYRISLINLDRAIRNAQDLEDAVKLDVLDSVRSLRVAAEDLRIQAVSIEVAERQVALATQNFELGRGEVRDLTEAQDDLINAQNAFVASLVDYRVAQLEFQRDLGTLLVDEQGLFQEADLEAVIP